MSLEDKMQEQSKYFRLVYDSAPRYVNDHSIIAGKDGTFHLFHIVGPVGKSCYDRDSEESFGHATSSDLCAWRPEMDVLSVDPNSAYEPHHVFAPYVCEKDGKYYLFYAGINEEARIESMCLACSDDLFHWSKYPHNPVFRPSRYWAEYDPYSEIWGCCRDPHILRHATYGYILYYVAWIKGTKGRIAALGAAISDNLVSWQDVGPVMIREWAKGHPTASLESPCVVEKEGLYYLFYKHRDSTRLAVSDDPLQFTDKDDSWFSVAHASEVLEIRGRWYASSCSRELLDLRHETTDRTRGLYLACLEWGELGPKLTPFVPVDQEVPEI